MSIIQCTCQDSKCKTGIRVERDGLWLRGKDGQDSLMYVDPNTIRDLVAELRDLYTTLLRRSDVGNTIVPRHESGIDHPLKGGSNVQNKKPSQDGI
jgi:hypothetical protein